jgi:hypothetical protein
VPSAAIEERSTRLLEDKKNKPNVKRKHEDVEEEEDVLALFNTLSKEQKMYLYKQLTE